MALKSTKMALKDFLIRANKRDIMILIRANKRDICDGHHKIIYTWLVFTGVWIPDHIVTPIAIIANHSLET